MKKPLLKPPEKNDEIIFLPHIAAFLKLLRDESIIGTAHQPYFFHPGIALKFLFIDILDIPKKKIIFVDTDKIKVSIKIPTKETIKVLPFLDTDEVLYAYQTPQEKKITEFFISVENEIKKNQYHNHHEVVSNFLFFKDMFMKNINKKYLKDVLAESFIQYFDIKTQYMFLSEVIKSKYFEELFLLIYNEDKNYRKIFNQILDEYKDEFRFRYKNFPFPKLTDDELPFWILHEGKRIRCFKKDVKEYGYKKCIIIPRASTLTLFLRLYKCDYFVHGIGGANYEWVQNRIIERFFKKPPLQYAIISGTFFIDNMNEREFPYFFYNQLRINKTLKEFMKKKHGIVSLKT